VATLAITQVALTVHQSRSMGLEREATRRTEGYKSLQLPQVEATPC
jgi:hypothetical protein